MATIQLVQIAHGRSGDKGDICNVGLIAHDDAGFKILQSQVTAEAVKEHFGSFVTGQVEKYEMPNIRAVNFVMRGALDGGATRSLRSDHLGKVMYAWLLRMTVEIDD